MDTNSSLMPPGMELISSITGGISELFVSIRGLNPLLRASSCSFVDNKGEFVSIRG